jgi:aspartyl/glutamyl-tRNA(Asn/Gln) amidotransferase C subunit
MIDTSKIADLSRLAVTQEEEGIVKEKFLDVLTAFDVLKSVEIGDGEEFLKPQTREDLRKDEKHISLGQEKSLNLAPQAFKGHFRVPSVL